MRLIAWGGRPEGRRYRVLLAGFAGSGGSAVEVGGDFDRQHVGFLIWSLVLSGLLEAGQAGGGGRLGSSGWEVRRCDLEL
ncbi:hypothetical protein KFK09_018079 [Dendrobium nobile]|uniref:Uncharacterized protein n=1 Tax=Dendrobium nobile TaxID=94219 RepID=A0A8T3AUT7_DENNO|nr:hypothetical protein KFK09_018079 [Dendrobium nobile]